MYLEKYATDYETLFSRPDIIDNFKNCIVYIPISNIAVLYKILEDTLGMDIYDNESKAEFYKRYENIISFVDNNIESTENTTNNQTEPLVFNSERNLYISFYLNSDGDFPDIKEEGLEDFTEEDADVISAALKNECSIITTNKRIEDVIKINSLPIMCLFKDNK